MRIRGAKVDRRADGRQGNATHLSLLGKLVHLVQTGSGDPPFEDAVVLLGVHVERLLIHGSVILDLVHRLIWLSRLGLGVWLSCGREMVLEEEMGRVRDGCACGRGAG